jgi:hypothetical protein
MGDRGKGADLWRRTHLGDHNAFDDSWNNRTRRLDGRKHGVFVGCPGEFVCALQGRDPRQFGCPSALLVLVSIVFWTLPAMAVSRLTVSDTPGHA